MYCKIESIQKYESGAVLAICHHDDMHQGPLGMDEHVAGSSFATLMDQNPGRRASKVDHVNGLMLAAYKELNFSSDIRVGKVTVAMIAPTRQG